MPPPQTLQGEIQRLLDAGHDYAAIIRVLRELAHLQQRDDIVEILRRPQAHVENVLNPNRPASPELTVGEDTNV